MKLSWLIAITFQQMAQQQQDQSIFKIKMVIMLTQTVKTVKTRVTTTTASCSLAVRQDDIISTLLRMQLKISQKLVQVAMHCR